MKRKEVVEIRDKVVPFRMAKSEQKDLENLVQRLNKTPRFRWVPATKADVLREALKLYSKQLQ